MDDSTTAARLSPARSDSAQASDAGEGNIKDTIESILVAFILAFIFRAFVVEAFVIPTGSMANTLYGYHKETTCEKCGYRIRVNASEEAENGRPTEFGICPNCRYKNQFHGARQGPFQGGGP